MQTYGENNIFGPDRIAIAQQDLERPQRPGNLHHLAVKTNIQTDRGDVSVPLPDNRFSLAGLEWQVAAQLEIARFRHDVFTFLKAKNSFRRLLP